MNKKIPTAKDILDALNLLMNSDKSKEEPIIFNTIFDEDVNKQKELNNGVE
jgi:hypothetical protein